jgi:hypothetical protein
MQDTSVMSQKFFHQNVISTPAKTGGEILCFSIVKRSLPEFILSVSKESR